MQWKTPDDGQRNCPKHVEFHSKNSFEKLVHLVGLFWSCLQAAYKTVWHIPLLCVQWKTPDDGQRNCLKHVEFHSKNKFEKLVHLVVSSWSCSLAVSKTVWHIPFLCVQWKTPVDGQRNCPKHVEFHSKNKFEKLVHLVGFIVGIYHDARSHEHQIRIYGTSNIAPHFLITSKWYFFFTRLQNGRNFKLQACFSPQAAHVDIFPNKSSLQLKIREVRQKVMGQYPPTMTPSGLASPMASSTDSAATTPGICMAVLFSIWRWIENLLKSLLGPVVRLSATTFCSIIIFWDWWVLQPEPSLLLFSGCLLLCKMQSMIFWWLIGRNRSFNSSLLEPQKYYTGNIRRYFKKFLHFFVCRVLVSVRLLRVGSIVHHILIVWSWLWLVPILSVWVAIER